MKYVLVIFIAYILGSSSMSFYLAKLKNVDIKNKGSKNLGASNTMIFLYPRILASLCGVGLRQGFY